MKIAIVDTDHYFYIYSLVTLFGTGNNEITIYTTPKIYSRCTDDLSGRKDIKYVVRGEKETWGDFLQKNVEPINTAGYGYVFLCPIYNFYKEHYEFISKLTTLNILVVFNLNGWINPPLTKLKWFWPSWYKRKIIKLIKWIAIDEHFHDHAIKLGCKNNILHIPSLLYDEEYVSKRPPVKAPVKIIVPGSIHKERRDYEVVLAALEIVLAKRQDFDVVFLGDPIGEYGKEIQKKAAQLNEKYGKSIIHTYQNEYNDAEFLRQIVLGHFLIAPVLPEFDLDGITEVYGTSKSTGSCFDILAYAIPGVFPSWLSVNKRFDSSTLRYKNATDLSNIIFDFVEHPEKIEKLRANSLINSSYYTVENVRERILKSIPPPKEY
jgi:glycosyltransferase involved in cell wall biosynthesis